MKKTEIKTGIRTNKLHVERQVLRALKTRELDDVVGGTLPSTPTQVSGAPRVCCA